MVNKSGGLFLFIRPLFLGENRTWSELLANETIAEGLLSILREVTRRGVVRKGAGAGESVLGGISGRHKKIGGVEMGGGRIQVWRFHWCGTLKSKKNTNLSGKSRDFPQNSST